MPVFGVSPPNLLETIFDSVGVAVLVADVQRRIVYANDAAHELFGVERPLTNLEELTRNCRVVDSQGREVPFEQLGVIRALAGETVAPESIQVIFADGQRKWLHSSAHLFSVMGSAG